MKDVEYKNKACFNLDIYQAIQSHKRDPKNTNEKLRGGY